ncbi:MAG: hypothetical protein JXB00_05280 [Bacteroidales bacterium]|nr:hypothetical protein [Bacteroidales bacterium]
MRKRQFLIFIISILFNINYLCAQQISRDVVVVKPYEPTLSDVYKISVLPEINDSVTAKPKFDYSILPVRVEAPFEPKPINAAKMVGTPLEKLYRSYIMLGLGNYFTPVAEYNINSLRSKDNLIGLYFRHRSSGSKITLDNGDKVPAGYAINHGELYGKKFYAHSSLSGNFTIKSDVIHHYGYNTDIFPDTTLDIKGKDIKQNYTRTGFDFRFNSTYSDSMHLNYDLNLSYNNLTDKFKNYENRLDLNTLFNKRFGNKVFGIDLGLTYVDPGNTVDSLNSTLFSATPWFSRRNSDYEFIVGGKIIVAGGSEKNTYFYPHARLQFNVVEKILIPYVGIDGDATLNTYDRLSNENPYIVPASKAKITNRLYIYGGFKGLFSSKSGYNLTLSYSIINNMPLFIIDSTGKYDNMFKAVTDNVKLVKYAGEIYYDPYPNLNLSLGAAVMGYDLDHEKKAWHKPDYELTLGTKYNIRKKIYASLDMAVIGSRYVQKPDETATIKKLKPVFDLNLGLEYRYSKILSFYLNFYNLTSSGYYIWHQYPARKLNVIAGFSYKI